jgi:hypothetical protein
LVVGVVHDTDGVAVPGATVTLRGPGGSPAGTGTTSADGTFAVGPAADVNEAEVRCTYCLRITVPVVPGRPIVAVVRRFAALRDTGISAADARALPYYSDTQLAALLPFVVTTNGSISDRGLSGARGAVVADGIALYRNTDGIDLGTAIPGHGTASIQQTPPTAVNAYDAYSSGGLFSIDTLDRSAGLVRADASSGVDFAIRGGNVLRGAFETAGGPDPATRAVAAGTVEAGGGTLDLRAVAASGMGANAIAFASTFSTPVRTSSLVASVSMARSMDVNGPENDSIAALSLRHGDLTYGVRAQRSSGFVLYGTGVTYDERFFVQFQHDAGGTHLFASLAAASSGETLGRLTSTNGALLPILSISTRIGASFAVHADSVDSLLSSPMYLLPVLPNGSAVDRSQLLDAGIRFDDGNRVRIDAMIFRQTTSGYGYGTVGGSGISAIWQIAPSLALRSWTLISSHTGSNPFFTFPGYPGGTYATGTGTLDRNVTWLTAGSALRVDAIWRSGNLEGDISIPAGQIRFVLGTRRDGTHREFTAGILWP